MIKAGNICDANFFICDEVAKFKFGGGDFWESQEGEMRGFLPGFIGTRNLKDDIFPSHM